MTVRRGTLSCAIVALVGLLVREERSYRRSALRAEDQLRRVLEKERAVTTRMIEVDRAQGDFISAVSHELRTPLSSIVGYVELLEDAGASLDRTQLDLVERIDRNSQRLLSLVEDLLITARVQEGIFATSRRPMDLRSAVTYALDAAQPTALASGVTLRAQLSEGAVSVDGDAAQLQRLAANLIGNAVKFTPAGGSVSVSLDRDGDRAVLEVSDTGVGVPAEEQDRLFDRFYRSSVAVRMAVQGSGLGLTIVQSIAQGHDGRVDVVSSEGEGTTFRFRMPVLELSAPRSAPRP